MKTKLTTQAGQFRRAVIDNKPQSGGLNYRTVLQYARECGGVRRFDGDEQGERFEFADGSIAMVRGLLSGNPRVWLKAKAGSRG